ncbi:hypothetical protein B9Q04_02865 [Candidatus Marsarchaeota G2 archaeon BE_D]|jgi:hypothetical protein|uniref:Uncharacterized protein n=1 Tax=Candidatus Marsarchaeota G2 archaeon BE_D TaxID=1978158 RepID=A0A2R6CDH7_9ARCH|nr:MAG: hypothetical protein B9Q04_02865 [Candidatus Marsarchaeota G2 archaeon BE_D]
MLSKKNLRLTCVGLAIMVFVVNTGILCLALLGFIQLSPTVFLYLGLLSSSTVLGVYLGFWVLCIPPSALSTGGLKKASPARIMGGTPLLLLPLTTLSPALYVAGYASRAYFTLTASLVIVALSTLIKTRHR